MNNNLNKMYKKNDELYTPRVLVEPIIQYIPKGWTVWCPFDTENSEFVLILKEHGYKVIHSHIWDGKDFLTSQQNTMIASSATHHSQSNSKSSKDCLNLANLLWF